MGDIELHQLLLHPMWRGTLAHARVKQASDHAASCPLALFLSREGNHLNIKGLFQGTCLEAARTCDECVRGKLPFVISL
jgi:hypothetical protein